jgi:hypothetical protein
MLGSSSSSPPRCAKVSSSWRPQTAACDKNVGSSSRHATRPAREDQQTVRAHVEPNGTGVTGSRSVAPRQADPPRRSEERPVPAGHLYDGSDRLDSNSLQRCRSRAKSTDSASTSSAPQVVDSGAALRRLQSLLIRGGRARTSMSPSSSTGAKDQPRPSQTPEDQPPSDQGSALPPLRRRFGVEQPPSRWAPSVQPPSKAHRDTR